MKFGERLREEFVPYGDLSAAQLERLEAHYQLLLHWNARLNLTRMTDLEEAVRFHYCESLFVGTVIPRGPLTVCDAGTGAGFPGIPLAIFREDLQVTLLEVDQRKAVFLREATREIQNARVLGSRIESCGVRFDWVVSRAVAAEAVVSSDLAPNLALLTTLTQTPPDFEVIRLPWGRDRVLALFHVEHSVVGSPEWEE